MTVIEYSWPTWVVRCDGCALSTWPPTVTQNAACARARDAFTFTFARGGKHYCSACAKKRKRRNRK